MPENPYILCTPGPLSTTRTVKAAMFRDWCTWDDDYRELVEKVRRRIEALATDEPEGYTSVLMQGSGTFSVESALGSIVPRDGKLLVLSNGAYGTRIVTIASMLGIDTIVHDSGELARPDIVKLDRELAKDDSIGHVIVVHNETTTGMLNPVEDIAATVKKHNRVCMVDAMSSFAALPMDVADMNIDVLISSANKGIQGVPGFGFVIVKRRVIEASKGLARSHSLDLYDQWKVMEEQQGKWRFTSPTHTVRAFYQALLELEEEGGVSARHKRYTENQRLLVAGMRSHGFATLLPDDYQSPVITSFLSPDSSQWSFEEFYTRLKKRGFVLYPGKVTSADTFRVGTIGEIYPEDIERLIAIIGEEIFW